MEYKDFRLVCKWLRDEMVSLNLNEDEIIQEWNLYRATLKQNKD